MDERKTIQFEFAAPQRILFGAGTARQTGTLVAEWGRRALVVVGAGEAVTVPVFESLDAAGISWETVRVSQEPTLESVEAALAQARQMQAEMVLGVGGGSALDTAKAVAALLTNPGELLDYLEVVGRGQALRHPSAACAAIPTTAGTGSEATRNAVVGVPEKQLKVSLRGAGMLPRLALVDPELTYSLPPEPTAYTGLDALTQVIEPFVSIAANPLTDAICREGMRRGGGALRSAYQDVRDPQAREAMSFTSLAGGLALANAKLGAVHGFAGVLGGMILMPHGAICARLLPRVMEINLKALQARLPGSPALERYSEAARLLTGNPGAEAADGVEWVAALVQDLHIPRLGEYGLRAEQLDEVVDKSQKASSMKGNPLVLTEEELRLILVQAL
jgi:alcohol dehydrogenase class IV